MIRVKILDEWRDMDVDQAKRMAWFYKSQENEGYADDHIQGATCHELLNN